MLILIPAYTRVCVRSTMGRNHSYTTHTPTTKHFQMSTHLWSPRSSSLSPLSRHCHPLDWQLAMPKGKELKSCCLIEVEDLYLSPMVTAPPGASDPIPAPVRAQNFRHPSHMPLLARPAVIVMTPPAYCTSNYSPWFPRQKQHLQCTSD